MTDGAPNPHSSQTQTPTQTTPAQRRVAFAVLLTGVVFVGMGQTIVFALLPPLADDLGLANFQILSIFMISAVFWVVCGPRWGRLSDNRGRRPFIMTGFAGFSLSMALFAGAINAGLAGALSGLVLYAALIATRLVYGLIGSATPGASQAYIADRTSAAERTSGLAAFPAAFGLGALAGPLFAAAFAQISPVAPLYAIAVMGLLATLGVYFFLPEQTPPKDRPRPPRVSFFDPRIRSFLIFGLVTAVTTSIPVQFIGFYMIDRIAADDPLQYASIALSASAGAALFSQLVLVRFFSLPPPLLMRAGPLLILAGHLTIALSTAIGAIAFGMLLSGLGAGLIAPGFMGGASLAVRREEQGAVAGLSNAAAASGFITAPVIGSIVYAISPAALFLMTAGLAGIAGVYAFLDRSIAAALPSTDPER